MNESSPVIIRSASNPAVRRLVRLRDNRRRRQAKRILVDGWRECCRAVEGGLIPEVVYVDEGVLQGGPVDQAGAETREVLMKAAGRVQGVSEDVMQKISFGQHARGAVAEFAEPESSLDGLVFGEMGCVLVLDSIEKPGNLGAIFRSADAAGVDAVLLTGASTDRFNPNAIRGSLGTIFTVPSAVASREDADGFLRANGFQICAARVESSEILWNATVLDRVAIVLGSEADGLGDAWPSTVKRPVDAIRIPMHGQADSLNLSVSAALLVYEVARRRSPAGRS